MVSEVSFADDRQILDYSDDITLSSLVSVIVEQQAHQISYQAKQQLVSARSKRADSLFSGPSVISLSHQNDAIGSGDGLQEWESQIELPLWLSHQQDSLQALNKATSAEIPMIEALNRYNATTQLRQALWHVKLQEVEVIHAYDVWQTAIEIDNDVELRVANGELSNTDSLLTKNHIVTNQQAYIRQLAELKTALMHYTHLTGVNVLPSSFKEVEVNDQSMFSSHPVLAAFDQTIATLRANFAVAKYDNQTVPSVHMGIRKERGDHDEHFNTSLGIGFSFALNNDTYHAESIAESAVALAEAEVERRQLQHDLEAKLMTVTHELEAKRAQSSLFSKQLELTKTYYAVKRKEFELGEIGLIELLQAQAMLDEITHQQHQINVEIQALIAEKNQALGISF
jgi:hypothetical protein